MASPDDVKKSAELKQWLEDRIAELQEEMDRLRETLAIVDANLRASAFKPAIELLDEGTEVPERRELKRDKGGDTIALASVTSGSVTVEPVDGVDLKTTTPPFKSFLLGKILQGMKSKDEELVAAGRLGKGEVFAFSVKEESGSIRSLKIDNYREKARLNEVLSTVGWTFSRMLEK